MNLKKLLSVFSFTLILTSLNPAQNRNQVNPVCNPDFAQLLVEQQVSESKSVEETDKRIKILIRSADFLWTIDETTARKYLTEAFQTADARYKKTGFESKIDKGLYTQLPDYRFDVISAIARKDAKWAKALYEKVLKEYEEKAEDEKRDAFNRAREVAELLKIAVENAEDNPALTLQIVRRLMRNELINNWYFGLYQIAEVDQPLADQIYGELLINYANTEVYRLLYLSAYPFGNARIFGLERYSLGTSLPPNFIPNRNLQQRFLTTLFRKILTLTPENNNSRSLHIGMPEAAIALTALNELEPLVLLKFPDLLDLLQRAKATLNSLVTNEMLDSLKQQEKWQSEMSVGFDERLKKLEKLDSEGKLKDSDIITLVINLETEEQYKKTEFWVLKINDSQAREDTSNLFYFNRSQLAVKENRLEDAGKYADKVGEPEHRATLYFEIAEAELKTNKNRYQALNILDDVYKLSEKTDDTVGKTQIFFGLAFMYAKVEPSRAYDSLSNAVKVTNKLENPDIFATAIFRQISTRELKHYAVYNSVGFNMEEVFKTMAEKNFSLTLGQAEGFSDKYFRTLAVISTVRDCIKPKPETKLKAGISPK